jgi:two-component system response regulator YesN
MGGKAMIRVMISDDEPITRQGLTMLPWEEEGFTVCGLAGNGLEALELIHSREPDLLLTDIRMPGLDGIALMEKARKEYIQLKVIFMTAYHQLDYAIKAIELGASCFVLKPTDPDHIMNECRKVKQQIEMERERQKDADGMRHKLTEYQKLLQGKVLEACETGVANTIIRRILQELKARYMDELTIHYFSHEYHFHPDYLSRLFKKETGDNFMNVLTRIRMQKALELLVDPFIKVYEVAEQVGFRDSRYFGQLFKKWYGMTPQELRTRSSVRTDE